MTAQIPPLETYSPSSSPPNSPTELTQPTTPSNLTYTYQETAHLHIPCPHCLKNIKFMHLNHHISHFHTQKGCPMRRFGCDFTSTGPQIQLHIESECPYYKVRETLHNLENEIEEHKEARRILEIDYEALKREVLELRRHKKSVDESLGSSFGGMGVSGILVNGATEEDGDEEDDSGSVLFSRSMALVGSRTGHDDIEEQEHDEVGSPVLDTSRRKTFKQSLPSLPQNSPLPTRKSTPPSIHRSRSRHIPSLHEDDVANEDDPDEDDNQTPSHYERPSFQQFMDASPLIQDDEESTASEDTNFVEESTNNGTASNNRSMPTTPHHQTSHHQKSLMEHTNHSNETPLRTHHSGEYQFTYLGESVKLQSYTSVPNDDDLSSLVRLSIADEQSLMQSVDSFSWNPKRCYPIVESFVQLSNDNSTIRNANRDQKHKFVFAAAYGDYIFRDWNRIHEFSIIIDELSQSTGIRVGICDPELPLETFLGDHWRSYAVDSAGYVGNDSRWVPHFTQKLQVDDVVTVLLNLKEGSIEFRVNEESMGVVFREVRIGALVPCVNLGQGCQVTLI